MKNESSFSYAALSQGGSYMVIAPFGGDELALAGSVLYGARKENIPVSVLFVWDNEKSRSQEGKTEEALQCLGVPKESIHFLHIPFIESEEGRIEFLTGQGKGKRIESENRSFSWNQVISLVAEKLNNEKPAVIIAPDFEMDPACAMTSMAFEKAMSQVLSANTGYAPLVLKGFVRALGTDSAKDFPARHLTSQQAAKEDRWNEFTVLPNPAYDWENRFRLPVPEECRTMDLSQNVMYKALSLQGMKDMTSRLIHGDACYWIRRTDNLLYQGKVSGSTGQSSAVKDFQWLNWLGREENHKPLMEDYLWRFRDGDKGRNIRVAWKLPQHIEKIALHGNMEEQNCILESRLVFSNGYSVDMGEFPEGGREAAPDFPPQDRVDWIRFEVKKTRGSAAGISEIEAFSKKDNAPKLLKICVNGDFAYHWPVFKGEKVQISCWESGLEGPLNWYLNGERISLEDLNVMAGKEKEAMAIRVESQQNPSVFDTCVLEPVSLWKQWKLYRERKKTESLLEEK